MLGASGSPRSEFQLGSKTRRMELCIVTRTPAVNKMSAITLRNVPRGIRNPHDMSIRMMKQQAAERKTTRLPSAKIKSRRKFASVTSTGIASITFGSCSGVRSPLKLSTAFGTVPSISAFSSVRYTETRICRYMAIAGRARAINCSKKALHPVSWQQYSLLRRVLPKDCKSI